MLAFLVSSDESTIDPDAAIGQLEGVSATLRSLPSADLEEFRSFLQGLATEAEQAGRREDADLYSTMFEHLGLQEESSGAV